LLLRVVLFVCGAVIMSVEILASRVLAPEFGDTLQVWGALIGTFIGGLSLGYWLGGILADRWPTSRGLAFLTCVGGVLITLMVYFTKAINAHIYNMSLGGDSSVWLKPLVSAAILYGLPITMLGAVNPYCVRLATRDLDRLGKRVGGFYAISSLGSIVGTFLTAFYLVGQCRVSTTIRAEGLVLVALSVPLFVRGFLLEGKSGA